MSRTPIPHSRATVFLLLRLGLVFLILTGCGRRTSPSIRTPDISGSLYGKSFEQLQDQNFARLRERYGCEWGVGRHPDGPPEFGIALSGGGNRAAAFSMGVLQALSVNNILERCQVISSVSGGGYTAGWYAAQPSLLDSYQEDALTSSLPVGCDRDRAVENLLFDPDGVFQKSICRSTGLDVPSWYEWCWLLCVGVPINAAVYMPTIILPDIVIPQWTSDYTGLGDMYKTRLEVTYLRHPSLRIGEHYGMMYLNLNTPGYVVDPIAFNTILEYHRLHKAPLFIFNATYRTSRIRKGGSISMRDRIFEFTPQRMGGDSVGYLAYPKMAVDSPAAIRVPTLNDSIALSGAAVDSLAESIPWYLRLFLFLSAADYGKEIPFTPEGQKHKSIYLTDGGYTENLGAFSLIRRGCKNILIIDSEYESRLTYEFASYRRLQRMVLQELSMRLSVPDIDSGNYTFGSIMRGSIRATGGNGDAPELASVIYIKLAMPEIEEIKAYAPNKYLQPLEVIKYAADKKNRRFPQDPTSDQDYSERRFVAYRSLGFYLGEKAIKWLTTQQVPKGKAR